MNVRFLLQTFSGLLLIGAWGTGFQALPDGPSRSFGLLALNAAYAQSPYDRLDPKFSSLRFTPKLSDKAKAAFEDRKAEYKQDLAELTSHIERLLEYDTNPPSHIPTTPDFDADVAGDFYATTWVSDCASQDYYYFPVGQGFVWAQQEDRHSDLPPRCRPEVLYTWGTKQKVNELTQAMRPGHWGKRFARSAGDFINDRKLYTVAAPAATFGYGEVLVRLKVKEDTRFLSAYHPDWKNGNCKDIDRDLAQTSIAYLPSLNYLEYQICSPQVIASWSYDTSQLLKELIRDYRWLRYHEAKGLHQRNLYYAIMPTTDDPMAYLMGSQLHGLRIDGQDFSLQAFYHTLSRFHQRVTHQPGHVYAPDELSRRLHNFSLKPLWFTTQGE